jgi:hypothetical protein
MGGIPILAHTPDLNQEGAFALRPITREMAATLVWAKGARSYLADPELAKAASCDLDYPISWRCEAWQLEVGQTALVAALQPDDGKRGTKSPSDALSSRCAWQSVTRIG